MRFLFLAIFLIGCGDDAEVCGVPGAPCCLSGCEADASLCLPKRTCEAPAQCHLEAMIDTRPQWMCFTP